MVETRKLVAILAADVVGCSRLAGSDEDRTLARLRALRSDLIDPTIAVHNGRVVKRTGDGSLVEFRSVVDAVRCAIEVQNGMIERNAGLPSDRRIEFRVGIHVGDVVEESDGDLMGDGVNIAARLEGIAKPGAICLSEDAYRQVKSRLDLAVSDLGPTTLKNIAEPVRVYSLEVTVPALAKPTPQAEPGTPKSVSLALPDKPSIAVLPFQNMSDDAAQEYFVDGMVDDIITGFRAEHILTRSVASTNVIHFQTRVLVQIDQRLDEPLLRTTIAAEPRLKDLMILRFANYSTFKVPQHHANALLELVENTDQPDAAFADVKNLRVWVYAPGENAEYWDEFYEDGIMAIGWDRLGDLGQYGSLDDVTAALQQQYDYEPGHRPVNNARACYDFVHTVRASDRVFAKRGRNTIIGYGIVTGDYEHRSDRTHFKNVRAVRWEGRGTWESPAPLAVKALTGIAADNDFASDLENLIIGPKTDLPKPIPPAVREPYTIAQALDGLFMDEQAFRTALAIWERKRNLILQGAPGVGKSFIARRLAYALMKFRDASRVRTVQFHQSYSYEDFVQGYRPSGAGLSLQEGVFLEFCERARIDENETYVFTIDEINRGNLSKILGELMLLIEPDKRSTEWATKLAYAPAAEERFWVPPNVYLLGMMNTADRSPSLVDYALRRRFAFVTLRPEYQSGKFRQHMLSKGASAALVDKTMDRMSELNAEIAADLTNLGPGFCIGHSFFAAVRPDDVLNDDWYRLIVLTEIVPPLEEYWSDNLSRVEEWRDRLLAH